MAKKFQIIGTRGKSAYQYALDGGYTGTEAEFEEKMARELEVSYDYNDLNSKILATAIKMEVSGTSITVNDAAAVPLVGLNYTGDNVIFTISGGDSSKTVTVSSPDKLNLNDFVMNSPNTVITNNKNVSMAITYIVDTQIYINNLASSLTNAVVSLGGEV